MQLLSLKMRVDLFKPALVVAVGLVLSSCSPGLGQNTSNRTINWRPQQEVPRTKTVEVAQAGQSSGRQQSPLFTYSTARAFKAVAANEANVQGAGSGEQSLFIAEREALKDCTRRSEYQGECTTQQIGSTRLLGNDDFKDQQRWQYMQQTHQRLAATTPLRRVFRSKVLAPGSRVADATLWLANSFQAGGYAALQMPGYTCTGTLDPIEQSGEEVENDDKPVGLLEMACQSGQILYGGYASINTQSKLFYLEDQENERWEFLVSDQDQRVGNSASAFKRLFATLEELE